MTPRPRNTAMTLFLAVLISFSLACARTSIDSTRILDDGSKLPAPHLVLIQDYDVGADTVKLDSSVGSKLLRSISSKDSAAEQIELGKSIAQAMSERMAEDIRKLGLPAERSTGALPKTGGPFLVIRGQLLTVDEGNRFRRFAIGLGAGATEVSATTRVAILVDGKETPIEEFTVTGKSGRMPGAAVSLGAGAAADAYHNVKQPMFYETESTDLEHMFDGPGRTHSHLKQAAVATATGKAAVAAGSKLSDTTGASVQADAARGAKAIVKELTKLFRTRDWIGTANP